MTHKSTFHFPACMCLILCFLTISTHQDVLWFPAACFMVSSCMFYGFQSVGVVHVLWFPASCFMVSSCMFYGFQDHVLWFPAACFMVSSCMFYGFQDHVLWFPESCVMVSSCMFYGFQHHVLWFPASCFMVSSVMFYGFQEWVYGGVMCDYMNSPSFQQALTEKCRIYLDQGRGSYTLSFLKLLTLLGYSGPDTKAFQKSLKDAYEQWKQL
ncbi:hypothetical protein C8J56DRAFT_880888 [Mycena floridula]|nr:hypothetical protein C8J56DRAFT_880888 [Mycena floridula]